MDISWGLCNHPGCDNYSRFNVTTISNETHLVYFQLTHELFSGEF